LRSRRPSPQHGRIAVKMLCLRAGLYVPEHSVHGSVACYGL
jgi:hypothetical protein